MKNNLVVLNTFYNIKTNKYTRVEMRKREKTIIDYTVVRQGDRKALVNIKN